MMNLKIIGIIVGMILPLYVSAQGVFDKVTLQKEAMQCIPLRDIQPDGWLKDLLRQDLNGMVGNLDKILPELTVDDDIYGKKRLTNKISEKEVGNILNMGDYNVEYLWWNSETQSNWRDGYVRNAFLLNDSKHIKKVTEYINYILSTQDTDGYLGIYSPDLRYKFKSENGELWAQAALYRGLLAYYEFTKEKRVLLAVMRGVENVMANYPINISTPFKADKPYGGVCHGLVFTDILDKLYQYTLDVKYWDYALFLYKDYCSHEVTNSDVQYANIMNPDYKMKCHGVHSYEHLRPLTVAAFASGSLQLQEALSAYLRRIDAELTPTGAPVGDEWILERTADATHTGYEYCSIHELFDSYMQLALKTGDKQWIDRAEKLYINAALGARHPHNGSCCYLKTDNSYEMTGTKNGEYEAEPQPRYKYSFVHQDAAVCCAPNAGRITPYYIHNMWMKDESGLVAQLFGTATLTTIINGQTIKVKEETAFPDVNVIRFVVEGADKLPNFILKIRRPQWARSLKLNKPYIEKDGYIVIDKNWSKKEEIKIDFYTEIEKKTFNNNTYFTYGVNVFALPIEAKEIQGRVYPGNYTDLMYKPLNLTVLEYKGGAVELDKGNLILNVGLLNPNTGKVEKKQLVPVRKTILRQVTF